MLEVRGSRATILLKISLNNNKDNNQGISQDPIKDPQYNNDVLKYKCLISHSQSGNLVRFNLLSTNQDNNGDKINHNNKESEIKASIISKDT